MFCQKKLFFKIILLILLGCGKKTSPVPINEITSSIPALTDFHGFYREIQPVFTWSVTLSQIPNIKKFVIKSLTEGCFACQKLNAEKIIITLKKADFTVQFLKNNQLVSYQPTLKIKDYFDLQKKIENQTIDKNSQQKVNFQLIFSKKNCLENSSFQLFYFNQNNDVSLPSSMISLHRPLLRQPPIIKIQKKLKHQLLLTWQPQYEMMFHNLQTGGVTHETIYLGMNFYNQDLLWPINAQPIYGKSYILDLNNPLYARFVDRFGNESLSAKIIQIK